MVLAQQNELYESLFYLKMAELRKISKQLQLPFKGTKSQLIERIKHFIETGKALEPSLLPSASKAQKNQLYPLGPDTRMMVGAYKNDAQTRAFFKKLIGPHFHFTAFGIDWLNERWRHGNPPTYHEFAQMWQEEFEKRKKAKPMPKKEWAYITFVQQYIQAKPHATKMEITEAWNAVRAQKVAYVLEQLKLT